MYTPIYYIYIYIPCRAKPSTCKKGCNKIYHPFSTLAWSGPSCDIWARQGSNEVKWFQRENLPMFAPVNLTYLMARGPWKMNQHLLASILLEKTLACNAMVSDPNGFTGVTHREEGWRCSSYLTCFNLKNKNHNTQAWPRAKARMQSGQRLEAKCDATEIAQPKAQIMMLKRKYEQMWQYKNTQKLHYLPGTVWEV